MARGLQHQALTAAGIPRRPVGGQRLHPALTDQAWLRRRYIEEAVPVTAIAAEVGCSEAAARRALAAAGIARRPRGGQRLYPALTDRAWLPRRYWTSRRPLPTSRPRSAVANTRCAGR